MMDASIMKIATVGLIALIAFGLLVVVWHRIKRDMGFGYRFIQTLAVVEIIPSIVLLAVLGILKGEATAALIGGLVGYVFGLKSKEDSN